MSKPQTPQRDPQKLVEAFREAATAVLAQTTGYDMIPRSGKVVVFDLRLPVKHAFLGLLEHEIKCAPVWDESRQAYASMLTVTDFIDILLHYHSKEEKMSTRVGQQTIQDWMEIKAKQKGFVPGLLQIRPSQSLLHAVKMIIEHKVHRVCIVQQPENNVCSLLTHQSVLRLLYVKLHREPFMDVTVRQAAVGTFNNIITVTPSTPLAKCLQMMREHSVSAVPVLKEGKAVDAYTRSDVRYLAFDHTFDINAMTVGSAMDAHKDDRPVPYCSMDEPLRIVCQRLLSCHSHRLFILDAQLGVQGVLSISDLFAFVCGVTKEEGPPTPRRNAAQEADTKQAED